MEKSIEETMKQYYAKYKGQIDEAPDFGAVPKNLIELPLKDILEKLDNPLWTLPKLKQLENIIQTLNRKNLPLDLEGMTSGHHESIEIFLKQIKEKISDLENSLKSKKPGDIEKLEKYVDDTIDIYYKQYKVQKDQEPKLEEVPTIFLKAPLTKILEQLDYSLWTLPKLKTLEKRVKKFYKKNFIPEKKGVTFDHHNNIHYFLKQIEEKISDLKNDLNPKDLKKTSDKVRDKTPIKETEEIKEAEATKEKKESLTKNKEGKMQRLKNFFFK
ncbi:hypothetical protein [Holospora curviuscula]|nr:hypothetical protein [Holospora curviuscula]